jgi:micrococcal nuclease
VYDGDTFTFIVDLGFDIKVKSKLRLYGVDTPEMRGKDKPLGKIVRDYVRDEILNQDVNIIVYKKGKFGRYIADVFPWHYGDERDMMSLSDDLVKKRMAVKVYY